MRKSNFELLRIIAMLMVVILHVTGKTAMLQQAQIGSLNFYIIHFFQSFSAIAVTLFVFITGYFGSSIQSIQFKKIKPIYTQIIFYSFFITGVFFVIFPSSITFDVIIKTIFPVISMSWWFISAYIILLFLVPYINKMLAVLSEKEFTILVLIIIFIGFVWTTFSIIPGIDPIVKGNGFDITTFCMWYIIGVYIKKYSYKILINKYIYLLGYVAFSTCIFMSIIISTLVKGSPITFFYGYNNILVLGAAISLFLFFEKLDIYSQLVNKIATLTLGVYLIHEHELIQLHLYKIFDFDFSMMGAGKFFIFIFVLSCFVFTVCAIIEKLRCLIFAEIRFENKIFIDIFQKRSTRN